MLTLHDLLWGSGICFVLCAVVDGTILDLLRALNAVVRRIRVWAGPLAHEMRGRKHHRPDRQRSYPVS